MLRVGDSVEIVMSSRHSRRKQYVGMRGIIERISLDNIAYRVKFVKTKPIIGCDYVKIGDTFCELFYVNYLKLV